MARRAIMAWVLMAGAGLAHGAELTSTKTLLVCPSCSLKTPSEAAKFAKDGDTIEIMAGEYQDSAIFTANNLTLRGIEGRPHIRAPKQLVEGKAVWLLKGNDSQISHIEISGAKVNDRNGAAIRLEGRGLMLDSVHFHHNENGVLVGDRNGAGSRIRILRSEIAHNGAGDGQSHNVYVGAIDELYVEASYLHHAKIGSHIKSRARRTEVRYNFLGDENSGSASYNVELPNGGDALLLGNIFQKGQKAQNWAFVSHGAEKGGAKGELLMVHNTFVSVRENGAVVLNNTGQALLRSYNNFMVGKVFPYEGGESEGDVSIGTGFSLFGTEQPFLDPRGFDYHLLAKSSAVDAGVALPKALTPTLSYQHPAATTARIVNAKPDAGAYEYESIMARR